jgi:hypothetical protein
VAAYAVFGDEGSDSLFKLLIQPGVSSIRSRNCAKNHNSTQQHPTGHL